MDLYTLSAEDRKVAISKMDDATLTASLATAEKDGAAAFANQSPTIAEVDAAEQIAFTRKDILAEQKERQDLATKAAERFAAAKQTFAINDGVETSGEGDEGEESEEARGEDGDDDGDDDGDEDGDDGDDGETVEAASGSEDDSSDEKKKGDFPPKKKDEEKDAVTTASARGATRVTPGSAARKVGAKTTRPAKASTPDVVITASADVPEVAMGTRLNMMGLAEALIGRARGFAPHNERQAEMVRQSGKEEDLRKFSLASIGHNFDKALVASAGAGVPQGGKEYDVVKHAIKEHQDALVASITGLNAGKQGFDGSLTAAGWCAPSEVTYSWLADYQTSGLLTLPQVQANRGGLMLTTGPALAEQYQMNGSDFGFGGTEAQAEAGYVKTCETIVCPDFLDHRLDFIGYCWKFPLLTEAAFPELVKDALRLSSVLYAHRLNTRRIGDITAMSTASTLNGLGATFTDTLEALTAIAVKERRRLNLSETAVMEVKMPVVAKEIFRADVSRRMMRDVGAVTDQQINAEFTARHLSPEYLSDMADGVGPDATFPAAFPVLVYPAGTFVEAMKDVINVQAVYDAASLSVNEYTGVFFEQGFKVIQAGYRSHKFTVPVCTAGLVGAPILDCHVESDNVAGEGPLPAAA
jgi:hypothetical protein